MHVAKLPTPIHIIDVGDFHFNELKMSVSRKDPNFLVEMKHFLERVGVGFGVAAESSSSALENGVGKERGSKSLETGNVFFATKEQRSHICGGERCTCTFRANQTCLHSTSLLSMNGCHWSYE
jgi:hypothetical protein